MKLYILFGSAIVESSQLNDWNTESNRLEKQVNFYFPSSQLIIWLIYSKYSHAHTYNRHCSHSYRQPPPRRILFGWNLTLGSVADCFQDSAKSGESTILSHKNEGKDDLLTEIMTCVDSPSKSKINSRILSHLFFNSQSPDWLRTSTASLCWIKGKCVVFWNLFVDSRDWTSNT